MSFRALGWYLGAIHPAIVPHLEHLAGGRRLLLFINDVGLREEGIKLLFALLCLGWLQTRPAPPSALTTAALVGRVFSTMALHVVATGLCGGVLSQTWRHRPHVWARFLATFLTVVVVHGLYDWAPGSAWVWLQAGGTSWLSQVVVIALVGWFFILLQGTQPVRAYLRAALVFSATARYALALGLTWVHWRSLEAVWICSRECLLFLPAVLFTALLFVTLPATRSSKHNLS